jgi:hypothetical protein
MPRARLPLLAACVLALSMTASAQDQAAANRKPPERGSRVVAEGCLAGATLDAASIRSEDGKAALEGPLNYQLKGDKRVLKQMREQARGFLVRVTGVLKSKLSDPASPGRKVGGTTISIGVAPSPYDRNGPMAGRQEPQPVLDVDGFDALPTRCR